MQIFLLIVSPISLGLCQGSRESRLEIQTRQRIPTKCISHCLLSNFSNVCVCCFRDTGFFGPRVSNDVHGHKYLQLIMLMFAHVVFSHSYY